MEITKYYVIWMASSYGFNGYEVVDYFEDYKEAQRCLGEYRMNGGRYVMASRYVREDKDINNCRYAG